MANSCGTPSPIGPDIPAPGGIPGPCSAIASNSPLLGGGTLVGGPDGDSDVGGGRTGSCPPVSAIGAEPLGLAIGGPSDGTVV